MSFDLNEINTGDVKSSEQDYVGYTVKTFESGLYKAKITQCYGITPNDKQAKTKGLHFDFEIESTNEDGNIELSEFSTSIWITNKKGEAFFINKDNEKQMMPNYNLAETITFAAVNKLITELGKPTNEIIQLWNFQEKKEVPTEVPMFKELIGKTVGLGLIKKIVNKTVLNKATGLYEPVNTKNTINEIDKVFRIVNGKPFTMTEVKTGVEEPTFFVQWLNRNKGNTRDTYQEVSGGTQEQPVAGQTTESLFD